MVKTFFTLITIMMSFFWSFGQESFVVEMDTSGDFQKELSVFFGWNWSAYTSSDISFSGADYDFTLSDVKATDRQSKFAFKTYFGPTNLTIPQTNYGIRYRFKPNAMFTFSVDHMKYVMTPGQKSKISGEIGEAYPNYAGSYADDNIKLEPDFLKFEHTDGLNYVNFGYARIHHLVSAGKLIDLDWNYGGAVGFLLPKTNSTLLGKEKYDDFHLSGFGLDVNLGLQVNIGSVFFLASQFKAGYISMPDIRTTLDEADEASQSFGFIQGNFLFGGRIKF